MLETSRGYRVLADAPHAPAPRPPANLRPRGKAARPVRPQWKVPRPRWSARRLPGHLSRSDLQEGAEDRQDVVEPRLEAAAAPGSTAGVPIVVLAIPCVGLAVLITSGLYDPEYPVLSLILGICAGLMLLGLNSPVWALGGMIGAEMTISDNYVPGATLSIRLAVVAVAVVLTSRVVLRQMGSPPKGLGRVAWPALGFVMVATLGNLAFSGEDYAFKYFRYQLAQFSSLVLVACVIRRRQDLVRILGVALVFGLITGIAAIWQHYDKETVFIAVSPDRLTALKGRSVGLAGTPVQLSNDLAFAATPLLGVMLAGGIFLLSKRRERVALVAAEVVLLVGLYFSFTRSSLFAVGPALAAMALCLRGYARVNALCIVAGAFVLYNVLNGTGMIGARYYKNSTNDNSAATHTALWTVGLAMALDRGTFGIGHDEFERLSGQYLGSVDLEGSERGIASVGTQRPHNDFISVWVSWGILALILYLALMLGIVRNCIIAARSDDLFIRGMAIGCLGGMVQYAVDSAFHNYLDSSTFLFIFAGLSVALVAIAERSRESLAYDRRYAPVVGHAFRRRERLRVRNHGYSALPG